MDLYQGHCCVVSSSMVAQVPACQLTAPMHLKSCYSSVCLHGGIYNTLVTVVSEHCIISKVLEDEWHI